MGGMEPLAVKKNAFNARKYLQFSEKNSSFPKF